ncbi:MAG: T9SS type A sorting domain-containing protein [Bacteroidales bacterium]|nr:T9SS type A sorting domain-containing protein [Bacteroidales bacterium]
MRTFITIALWLLATTMIAQEQQERPNMPFYNKQKIDEALKRQTEYDTVWLPIKTTQYNHLGIPSFFEEYEYNESGLLQKWIRNHLPMVAEYIFNQTRLVEGEDVLDTLTYYRYDDAGNKMPERRWIYENHQDDFYFAIYDQQWETNQWVTTYKREEYFMDTLSVVGFPYLKRWFTDGVLSRENRYALEKFDERGNVINMSFQLYVPGSEEEYVIFFHEYFYDENNACYEWRAYRKFGKDWILRGKVSWEWEEFHGFLNGDVLYFQVFGKPDFKKPNKPSTMSSYGSCDGWSLDFQFMEKYLWNIDGNNSAERATYIKSNDSLFRELNSGIYYDERGNMTGGIEVYMYYPYQYGNYHDTCYLLKHTYVNYYDERNRFYKYDFYQMRFDDMFGEGSRDDLFYYTEKVDTFTYVLKKVNIDELSLKSDAELLLVPNPTNETVRITAIDSIATIAVYASDGRLVHSQEGSGKEATVNLRGLSAGIYLVQARLRDGRVQMGKLVVR